MKTADSDTGIFMLHTFVFNKYKMLSIKQVVLIAEYFLGTYLMDFIYGRIKSN